MKRLSERDALILGAGAVSALVGAALLACSSSGGSPAQLTGGSAASGDDGGGGGGPPASCTSNALDVEFAPMYSAYDGVHKFQVPAIVNGVSANLVTWTASDPSVVTLEPDSDTGGTMITVQKAGQVTITAQAGNLCGSSLLTITQASADDWNAGNARYNDGVVLRWHQDAGPDAAPPQQAACTNCHGPTANGAFNDVAHTPEQTGGFSDDDLVNIFSHGQVPDGGYFDPSIVSYKRWQQFHQWDMTTDEAKGIVVYLRSLTPTSQTGTSNFGGHCDGGHCGHHDDGGDGPPPQPPAGDAGHD